MGAFTTDNIYKELRPLNVYDVAANETWLEDMAREGYHLTGFKGYSGVFEKGAPENWHYRMELLVKKEDEPSPERMAANEQRGWSYVATWDGRFHIWKSNQLAAWLEPAPGLDAEDFARLRRRILGTNAALLACMLLVLGLTAATVFQSDTPLWTEIYGSMAGQSLLLLTAALSALVLIVHEVVSGLRLLRALEEREPLERPRPYRWQKWLARISFAAGIAVALSGFLEPLWEEPWSAREKHGEDLKAGAVYVDLRELDGTPEEETFFFAPETKVHELAPRMWFIQQDACPGAPVEEQILVSSEYYRLLTKLLVPQLEKDLLYWCGDVEMELLESVELDSFWWGEQTNRDGLREQFVVATLGRNAISVQYRGPSDLRTQGAYFAELLSR